LGSTQEIHPREKEDLLEKKLVRIELEDGNSLLTMYPLERCACGETFRENFGL